MMTRLMRCSLSVTGWRGFEAREVKNTMENEIDTIRKNVADICKKKKLTCEQITCVTDVPGIAVLMAVDGKLDLPLKIWKVVFEKLNVDFVFVDPPRPSVILTVDANGEIRLPAEWLKKLHVQKNNRLLQLDNFDTHVTLHDSYIHMLDAERKKVSDALLASGYTLT